MAVGRNAPCPCGSGRKYKHCCEGKGDPRSRLISRLVIFVGVPLVIGAGCWVGYLTEVRWGGAVAVLGLAAIGAYFAFRNPPTSKGRSGADRIDFGR